jgi:undecaprenyl-diphosphatase
MQWLEALDIGSLYWFEPRHQPWLTPIMLGLSRLGDGPVILAALVLAVAGLLLAGRRQTAIILTVAALGAYGLSSAAKYTVNRPRPDVTWNLEPVPATASYPSNHAVNGMATYVTAALLASRRLRRRWQGTTLIVMALLLALGIGVSRLYLGVHFLTDVVGGWAVGLACALLALGADRRWARDQAPREDPANRPFIV